MTRSRTLLASAAWLASALFATEAGAAPLSIVNTNFPAVNCVFHTTCTIVVTDSVGNFTPPGDSGVARLQSRTSPGIVPAPAGGKMAYIYRVDLTSVTGLTAANCVTKLEVVFGPVTKEPYSPGALFDVFVGTAGGLGSVGLASASQSGNLITFNFASPVCPGATSFFFGLTSASTHPMPSVARVYYSLGGTANTADRVP